MIISSPNLDRMFILGVLSEPKLNFDQKRNISQFSPFSRISRKIGILGDFQPKIPDREINLLIIGGLVSNKHLSSFHLQQISGF